MRHPRWNYQNSGYYFITINSKNREEYFGVIREKTMHLSNIGKIADEELIKTAKSRPYVGIDKYVIMPDHVHLILILMGICGTDTRPRSSVARYAATDFGNSQYSSISPKPRSVSSIIRSYKSAVTKRCHENGHADFTWQSRFHDRIIRDEEELYNIRKYIEQNVMRWGMNNR